MKLDFCDTDGCFRCLSVTFWIDMFSSFTAVMIERYVLSVKITDQVNITIITL